jgi:hypothetical protein
MAVRCKINGNAKLAPGDKGECPECLTPDVPTTGKGFVGAHDVKLSLGEGPQIPVTDEGTRVGDPRDAAVRRELDAVEVRKGEVPVPAACTDPVEATGHGRGPVLVRGRAMEPFAGEMALFPVGTPEGERVTGMPEDTRKGWSSQTMNGPTGRERSEREAMVGGRYGFLTQVQFRALSRTQKRRYWDKVKKANAFAASHRRTFTGRFGTGGVGSASFAEGESRVTERIMREVPEH